MEMTSQEMKLNEAGFGKVRSLEGGLSAGANRIDLAMPKY